MARLAGQPESRRRLVEEPTRDEHGDETHPAWGLIGVSRAQNSPPGSALFDSDLRHQHTMRITIHPARRRRNLNRDWIESHRVPIIEVEVSEAQFASFVSSGGQGDGVPCTIRYRDGHAVPELPYEPRLRESLDEVEGAADRSLAAIREAFALVEEKPTKANLRNLRIVLDNAPANMRFAAESLAETAETVVERARADVEAFVRDAAAHAGLDAGEVGFSLALEAGDPGAIEGDAEEQEQ